MKRKRLSTKQVKTEKVSAASMRVSSANLPAFNGDKVSIREFFGIAKGKIRKRAFFFTLFGIISCVYAVLCMTPLVSFNAGLGTFLFGANATFGINYFMNERNKTGVDDSDFGVRPDPTPAPPAVGYQPDPVVARKRPPRKP